MEDNTPAYVHCTNVVIMSLLKVVYLLWCLNSPDLNMIEPLWFILKRQTTKKGAPQSRSEVEKAWLKAWRELP